MRRKKVFCNIMLIFLAHCVISASAMEEKTDISNTVSSWIESNKNLKPHRYLSRLLNWADIIRKQHKALKSVENTINKTKINEEYPNLSLLIPQKEIYTYLVEIGGEEGYKIVSNLINNITIALKFDSSSPHDITNPNTQKKALTYIDVPRNCQKSFYDSFHDMIVLILSTKQIKIPEHSDLLHLTNLIDQHHENINPALYNYLKVFIFTIQKFDNLLGFITDMKKTLTPIINISCTHDNDTILYNSFSFLRKLKKSCQNLEKIEKSDNLELLTSKCKKNYQDIEILLSEYTSCESTFKSIYAVIRMELNSQIKTLRNFGNLHKQYQALPRSLIHKKKAPQPTKKITSTSTQPAKDVDAILQEMGEGYKNPQKQKRKKRNRRKRR